VLQDQHNEVARRFGLVFRLPEDLRNVYRKLGADLEEYNGDASWELPIPGSYLISQDGLIKYAAVDPDYTVRPEPDEITDAIKKLGR